MIVTLSPDRLPEGDGVIRVRERIMVGLEIEDRRLVPAGVILVAAGPVAGHAFHRQDIGMPAGEP